MPIRSPSPPNSATMNYHVYELRTKEWTRLFPGSDGQSPIWFAIFEKFVFMEDIVTYSSDLKEHAIKLGTLLGRLKTAGLTLHPEKCRRLQREIVYVEHVISEAGVQRDPEKILAFSKSSLHKKKRRKI